MNLDHFRVHLCFDLYHTGCICVSIENLRKEVDELKVATFMYQICAAMKYIHSRNVIHLDLKVTKQPKLIKI